MKKILITAVFIIGIFFAVPSAANAQWGGYGYDQMYYGHGYGADTNYYDWYGYDQYGYGYDQYTYGYDQYGYGNYGSGPRWEDLPYYLVNGAASWYADSMYDPYYNGYYGAGYNNYGYTDPCGCGNQYYGADYDSWYAPSYDRWYGSGYNGYWY